MNRYASADELYLRGRNILLILATSTSARIQLLSEISSFFLRAWDIASQLSLSFSWNHIYPQLLKQQKLAIAFLQHYKLNVLCWRLSCINPIPKHSIDIVGRLLNIKLPKLKSSRKHYILFKATVPLKLSKQAINHQLTEAEENLRESPQSGLNARSSVDITERKEHAHLKAPVG